MGNWLLVYSCYDRIDWWNSLEYLEKSKVFVENRCSQRKQKPEYSIENRVTERKPMYTDEYPEETVY